MRVPLRTSTTALATSLVIAAAMNIPISFVDAQQPGRGPVSRESRGILKSIDVKTRAVTSANRPANGLSWVMRHVFPCGLEDFPDT